MDQPDPTPYRGQTQVAVDQGPNLFDEVDDVGRYQRERDGMHHVHTDCK